MSFHSLSSQRTIDIIETFFQTACFYILYIEKNSVVWTLLFVVGITVTPNPRKTFYFLSHISQDVRMYEVRLKYFDIVVLCFWVHLFYSKVVCTSFLCWQVLWQPFPLFTFNTPKFGCLLFSIIPVHMWFLNYQSSSPV